MKQVTQEEFYNTVGKMDVVVSSVGSYPFTQEWTTRSGRVLVGINKPVLNEFGRVKYPPSCEYFVN